MERKDDFPQTLQAAIQFFSNEETCIAYFANIRWPNGVVCPNCGDKEGVYFLSTQKRFKCRACKKQFSVKVGSIFEDSPISLTKWLPAMWLICGAKNGISSYEIGRALGVSQKTAWFMMHRIRLSMTQGTFDMMGDNGPVEVDETYIGGKARNMHKSKRTGRTGGAGKQAVFGLLERHGEKGKSKVRVQAIPENWKDVALGIIRENVAKGSAIYSDEHGTYRALGQEGFEHGFVRHAEYYVDGVIHTNGVENFWTLLKRTIKGTYVSVEPFHIFRYLDEQAFRFNEREGNDADRFKAAINEAAGRRVTWNKLTGKEEKPSVNGEGSELSR